MEKTDNNPKFFINPDYINNLPPNANFSEIFSAIKRKLHIKKTRKAQVDSLLKKTKCKFLQTVQDIIKNVTNENTKKLPQDFVTNITFEYNRKYLDVNIIKIFNEFGILDENFQVTQNKELFEEFAGHTFSSLYNEYIQSNKYKKDLKYIIEKNGKNIGILYEFVSKNFINYYVYSKRNLMNEKIKGSEKFTIDEKIENENNN